MVGNKMNPRQMDVLGRKEVIDLLHQRLDGSIKSLRELKSRIAEETGEQIPLTTLWQNVHRMRGEATGKPTCCRGVTSRVSRSSESRNRIQVDDDYDGDDDLCAYDSGVEHSKVAGPPLRRSTRVLKRKSYSPTFTSAGSDSRKSQAGSTPVSNNNITMVTHSVRCLGMPKKQRITRRKKVNEPKDWDRDMEEIIRQEALRHEEETIDDPLARAKSKVWLFCEKIEEDGESKAKCRICGMVMLRRLGSTRAMLRHLRKMHNNLIEGIIRPVTKRVTSIAGKPRANDGFDIDDDSAWVEELDEEDFDDFEEQYTIAPQCIQKAKVVSYGDYQNEKNVSFTNEVFVREDGSYAEGDEYVDVVYVQDGNSFEEVISRNDGSALANKDLATLESGNSFNLPLRLKRSISDSDIAHLCAKDNIRLRLDDTNLEAASRPVENINLLSEGEKAVQDAEDDEHFGRSIASTLRTFSPSQRELVRCAIVQCIEEMRTAEVVRSGETGLLEDGELLQISDV
ncbi:unnamed protein product [Thelazia callipaeda]|uniref:BED-type domain-containing protein n=1 Tax=Thelazia callipaeda TaxID=103827 RepID=A0A0N5CSB1_THECL|nr:unnamed protein product [Thelazia callipaeda]